MQEKVAKPYKPASAYLKYFLDFIFV
jgi:hypothetical protein